MEKITLNEYLKQGSVVENLKNFVGVTPENTVGLMTPERLAAVAGESMSVKTPVKDLDTCTTTGCYVTTHNATGLPDKTGEAPCVVFRVYNKGIPCALQILFHGSILYVRLVWVGGITSWSKFNPSNEAISTGSNF